MALIDDRDAADWNRLLDDLDDPRVQRVYAEISAYLKALKRREAGYLDDPIPTALPDSDRKLWWALGFTAGLNAGMLSLDALGKIARAALKKGAK